LGDKRSFEEEEEELTIRRRNLMKTNNPGEHKADSTGDLWRRAFEEMCRSLDRYGPDEILRILITNSHNDIVCRHLLATYPQVVAIGQFIASLPVFKPSEKRKGRKGGSRMTSSTSRKRPVSLFNPV